MAVYDAHSNLAISTVATVPSPATLGTSLVVGSGEGSRFPTAPFNATLWPANTRPDPSNAEIVRVTAVSTDTLTITRAQEGTSAKTVTTSFLIAATVTAKTVTDLETNTEYAFSSWKDFGPTYSDSIPSARASGDYILFPQGGSLKNTAASAFGARYFDPAWYGAGGSRTTKVRLCVSYEVGGTAPGVTITLAFYPVATWRTAAATERAGVATLGTVVCSAAITTPGANTEGHAESTEANFPVAGKYVVVETLSGTNATNATMELGVQLQYRQT